MSGIPTQTASVVGGASDVEGVDVVEPTPVEDPSIWKGDCGLL